MKKQIKGCKRNVLTLKAAEIYKNDELHVNEDIKIKEVLKFKYLG